MRNLVIVTGGCGFIGSNLVPALAEAGHQVRVVDNRHNAVVDDFGHPSVEIVEADVRDEAALRAAVDGADSVIHLAAYGSVIESIADPRDNFEVNARGTLNVLEACRSGGVGRMIFASTGGALIGDAEPPVNEASVPRPISPYGASKLCGEAYCSAFAGAYGMSTVAVRFANVYGPGAHRKKGAVTAFMKRIMSGQPIVIYGDGQASRDFLHVSDLCLGIRAALQRAPAGASVFHLASGREVTVLELADTIVSVSGSSEHPIRFEPARRGEVARNFATFDRARDELGFVPSIGLREGMQETWDWFQREHPGPLD